PRRTIGASALARSAFVVRLSCADAPRLGTARSPVTARERDYSRPVPGPVFGRFGTTGTNSSPVPAGFQKGLTNWASGAKAARAHFPARSSELTGVVAPAGV